MTISTDPPSDSQREVTGRHRTSDPHDRIDELSGTVKGLVRWRDRADGARSLGTFVSGGIGAIALLVAGAFGERAISTGEELATLRAQQHSDEIQLEALEARIDRAEDSRDAVSEQLRAVAVELGGLRVSLDALSQRMERIEERLDGAQRR